eukprot:479770_1
MSTSKKRKLEFLQESSNQCKKRKLSAPTKKIKSIFSHSKDHDEFLKYFHSIQQSSLPHSLNIPSDINKEIAAFSTGLIKKCSGSYCNARICVLNQDWIEFSNDTLSKWTYCSKTDKYFCDMCLPYTTHFHCCDTIQCFKGYRKCVWSGDEIKCRYIGYFDDDVSILSYKCMYCNNDMVWFEICDDCSELSCCYHSWVYKCDANEHNMCCQLGTVIVVMNNFVMDVMDHFGVIINVTDVWNFGVMNVQKLRVKIFFHVINVVYKYVIIVRKSLNVNSIVLIAVRT